MPCSNLSTRRVVTAAICLLGLVGFAVSHATGAAPSSAPAAGNDTAVDVATPDEESKLPPQFTMRARVTAATPDTAVNLSWRQGGEGLGGRVSHGSLGDALNLGEWSPAVAVMSFVPSGKFPRKLFLTVMVGPSAPAKGDKRAPLRNVGVEFEFRNSAELVKDFTVVGPDGGTVGLVIPVGACTGGRTPASPEFKDNLLSLLDYARQRAETLEKLPWAKQPVPQKYAILTDLGGYGQGVGYGIRTTDRAVVEAECRTLRQLGVNGLRNAPDFLIDEIHRHTGLGALFTRIRDTGGMGFPVEEARRGEKIDPASHSDVGCPFAPGVEARTASGVNEVLQRLPQENVDESWCLTVDEIGAVTDRSPQGKSHVATCDNCARGFQEYLKQEGITPADLGQGDWSGVRPIDIYSRDAGAPKRYLHDPIDALRAYWTARFTNYATARLFTPLRDALRQANDNSARAATTSDTTSVTRGKPLLLSYALRGNTFLTAGHSLDFFEFYRYADNAFVYETSNRDPRVWQWDSYLCDVGRSVCAERNLRFGIYIKPHRGAPIQRALTAVSRGATMLYWYTYGPDWSKGDTFGADPAALALTSKAARVIAGGEDVLYGSRWAVDPQVAVINPRSSEIWLQLAGGQKAPPARTAAWENAKWIYTALAHEHIAVDAIDETTISERPAALSRYKIIYVNGPNLEHIAAEKLARWVEAGGILYTSGGGVALDEANRPLTALAPVLGLRTRKPPEMWERVSLYKGTALQRPGIDDSMLAWRPNPVERISSDVVRPGIDPIIGREVLEPTEDTEVIGRFRDGSAAATRHAFGKGVAYAVGFFPGVEYSVPITTADIDTEGSAHASLRHWISFVCEGRVRPIVSTDHCTVEGVLLQNPATNRQAVTLMNWTYRQNAAPAKDPLGSASSIHLTPMKDVRVTIQGVASASTHAHSVALGQTFPIERRGDAAVIVLPLLEEGDVLLLE